MKRSKLSHLLSVICATGCFGIASRVEASTLYGSTSAGGPGELYLLDPATGAALQDIGALNDTLGHNHPITGLAFDPLNGILYGSTGGSDTFAPKSLVTIDPVTGLVTVVGAFNHGTATMSDLAFDQAGNLFGIGSSGGPNLYSINLSTGQATGIGSSGLSGTSGGGLAISSDGIYYGTPTSSRFGTYDPNSGAFSFIASPATPAGPGTGYAALSFDGNTLYGIDLGTPTHLVTIDPMGNVTDLGTSVASIDGIAFQPVPEPGTLTLLLGIGALGLFAKVRRK